MAGKGVNNVNCYDIILRATRYINPVFSFACIITLNLKTQHCSGRNIQYLDKANGLFIKSVD